jgi:hypothetical protein
VLPDQAGHKDHRGQLVQPGLEPPVLLEFKDLVEVLAQLGFKELQVLGLSVLQDSKGQLDPKE